MTPQELNEAMRIGLQTARLQNPLLALFSDAQAGSGAESRPARISEAAARRIAQLATQGGKEKQ